MPVTWRHPAAARWTSAALAVPCSNCGARIGRPCTTLYADGAPRDPHTIRIDVAEAQGFRLVADAPLLELGGVADG